MSDDIASLVIEVKSDGVDKAKRSLADLSSQGQKTESAVKNLGNESKKTANNVGDIASGSSKATTSLAGLASSAKYAALGIAGVGAGVLALGSAVSKTYIDFEKLNNTLKFSTGSAANAAKELEYIKSTVNNLGLELISTAEAYTKFSAATKGTALEGQKTRDVFEAVAKASAVMGLSADESSGALLAISQMMSKGTVSAEELRGQLGERLPGAFQIAAKSIGVTTQELGKMLEQGQIVAADFLPKFAEELTKTLGDSPESAAGSAQAQLNKLSNEWVEFKKNIAESGVMTIVLEVAEGTNNAMKWFNHFVFGKGQLADNNRIIENYSKIESIDQYITKNKDSKSQKIQSYIASAKEEKRRIERELGIFNEAKLNPASGITNTSAIAPDFSVKTKDGQGGYGTDVNKLNKLQEDANRAKLALQKQYEDEAKKRREKALNAIRDDIDKEQDAIESKYQFEQKWQDILDKQKADAYKEDLKQLAIRQEIANKNFDEAQRESQRIENERLKDFEDSMQGINQVFREGFAAMVNGGKASWKSFTKSLVTTFKTAVVNKIYQMFAEPFIVKIVAAIAGIGVSGAANASFLDGIMQTASGNNGIFGGMLDQLKSLNSNVVGSIEQLGAFLSNGNGGLADTIGGALGQYSSQIASALSFAPAVMSLLKGDIKGAAFQGAGAAIGTLIGGPIGGALGSFLGGAIGGLFGGEKKLPRFYTGVNSTLTNGKLTNGKGWTGADSKGVIAGTEQPLQQLNTAFAAALGGLLTAAGKSAELSIMSLIYKKNNTFGRFDYNLNGKQVNTSNMGGGDVSATFDELVNKTLTSTLIDAIRSSTLESSIKSLFDGLTDKTKVSDMVLSAISLYNSQNALAKSYGLTVDQAAKVAKATGFAGDELTGFISKLVKSVGELKTIGDVLTEARSQLSIGLGTSVPDSIKAFDAALKGIDKTTQDGIDSFLKMYSLREQFVAFTSSLNQLKGGVNNALLGIVSDSEKQAMLQADLTKLFSEFGLEVPGSTQDLIALGKSIDFTSKEGLDLAAIFPTLVTAFVNTKDAVDDLMDSLRDVENFKTIVDFNRYKGLAQNYGTSFANQYTDGQSVTYGASNNTTVSMPQVTASNNTIISTSDPNLLDAIRVLTAKFDALQLEVSKTAIQSKRAADVLVNVSPNGNAIQTEAVV